MRLGATHVRVGSALFGSAALGSAACPSCPRSKPSAAASSRAWSASASSACIQRRARPAGAAAGAVRRRRSRAAPSLGIDRRAKYLLIRLDDGQTLIVHLGMSGRMTLHDAQSAAEHPFERHDHVVFDIDDGWQVRFNDARRFGLMLLVADRGASPSTSCSRAWARSRSTRLSTAPRWPRASRADARRSRRPCSTRRPWSASAISTPARRCSWPASRRAARPTRSRASAPTAWSPRSSRCCCARSTMAARPCAIMSSRAASSAISRRASMSTTAPGALCPTRDCGQLVKRLVQSGRSTFYCAHCQR